MAIMIAPHSAAPSVSAPSIFGAALASAFAPGFVLGVAAVLTQNSGPHFIQILLVVPIIFSVAGGIVGAPYAALVFAPAILLLRRRWRLNWLAMTVVGYFSVFAAGLCYSAVKSTLATGVQDHALFAICGTIAGFAFWRVVGDVEKVAPLGARPRKA
jgi:hypothetical protein